MSRRLLQQPGCPPYENDEEPIKSSIGKLAVNVDEIRAATGQSGFSELPVLGVHCEQLARLPLLHRDPFDRMIVAQAMAEPMRLMTGDSQLSAYTELVQLI